MVSGCAAPVKLGASVSQCAVAIRIALGRGNRRASADHAAPAAPALSACIGEPCEMKRTGRAAIARLEPLPGYRQVDGGCQAGIGDAAMRSSRIIRNADSVPP